MTKEVPHENILMMTFSFLFSKSLFMILLLSERWTSWTGPPILHILYFFGCIYLEFWGVFSIYFPFLLLSFQIFLIQIFNSSFCLLFYCFLKYPVSFNMINFFLPAYSLLLFYLVLCIYCFFLSFISAFFSNYKGFCYVI